MRFAPITGTFGAEVSDIDLGEAFSDLDRKELEAAFVEHKVLVFRGQMSFDPAAHVRFGRLFGELEIHPFHPNLNEHPEVIVLETAGVRASESWHSDVTFRAKPPLGSVLKAVRIPPYGRDTMFADMTAAYEGLSSAFQRMVSGLTAIHDWRHVFAPEPGQEQLPPAEHPVVTTHPVSGRPVTFVNPTFTVGIKGMKPAESRAVLDVLYAQTRLPEYQLRVRWEPGSVVLWDNRSVQHALVFDSPERRVMHRVTIAGQTPA